MSHRRAKTLRQLLKRAGFVWSSNKTVYRRSKKEYAKSEWTDRETFHCERDRFKGPPL